MPTVIRNTAVALSGNLVPLRARSFKSRTCLRTQPHLVPCTSVQLGMISYCVAACHMCSAEHAVSATAFQKLKSIDLVLCTLSEAGGIILNRKMAEDSTHFGTLLEHDSDMSDSA